MLCVLVPRLSVAPPGRLADFPARKERPAGLGKSGGQARVNERGMGSPQAPPTLRLGLLIDSDASAVGRWNAPPTRRRSVAWG